jgi:hypothetical protein
VSMKNLLRRATTAATESGPPACDYLEPRHAEARIRIALCFRDAVSGGKSRDLWHNGDVK